MSKSNIKLKPCPFCGGEPRNKRTQPKQVPTPKKYYSDDQITKTCFEACKFMRDIKVGSVWCKTECEHCNGYDDEEQWVKCKLYAITPMEQKL